MWASSAAPGDGSSEASAEAELELRVPPGLKNLGRTRVQDSEKRDRARERRSGSHGNWGSDVRFRLRRRHSVVLHLRFCEGDAFLHARLRRRCPILLVRESTLMTLLLLLLTLLLILLDPAPLVHLGSVAEDHRNEKEIL